jgi:NADH-quinone oxidoreductase subunit F
VRNGNRLKAVIPGGISAKILRAEEIDVAMDFNSLTATGSMAGSGGVIVMDETTCMVEALHAAVRFFADESCGQCSPCRGERLVYRIMRRIAKDGTSGTSGCCDRWRHGRKDHLRLRRALLDRSILHRQVPG